MTLSLAIASPSAEDQAVQFFQDSIGQWRSERRYYTLKSGVIQEVVSDLNICYLEADAPALAALALAHGLGTALEMTCGLQISWDSQYVGPSQKSVQGATVFGLLGDVLYRDRGFATPEPVTAQFSFPTPRAMVLRTEYNQSLFEEEVKLIGDRYRTRQTVISRAGEEQMIGQYLERRVA
ncbi:MAG: phycobiliprotein lyase [Synechococcales cyanobacterium RM1_1_8]|nr:phycobiliprotein lyase [Synechococcales cyanobacterium RM1_1_8]